MENKKEVWTPVFIQDDVEFVLPYSDFACQTEDDAHNVGVGTMFFEGVFYGFKYAWKNINLMDDGEGLAGNLGPMEIIVIDCPDFEKRLEAASDEVD